jgi:aryl-alcohol dehydrogenase-like predicted oxidoreductase
MQFRPLGRTGMKVSRLCLGTMNFGSHTEEKDAFRIMDAALDAGINFFDSANVYGGEGHRGRTEEIIGRWFAQGGGRRQKVVLATKVFGFMDDPLDGPNNASGLSAYKIRRHAEGSLRRLGTDHIELYQMHHVDRSAPWEEIWEAFEILVRQGKVGYVGSSNFAGWHLVEAQAEARRRGFMGLVSEQHKYSLVCRLPELEVLPAAQALGIGVIAYSPLAGGLLGGGALEPRKGTRAGGENVQKEAVKRRAQLESFGFLCREIGKDMGTVALAWTLAHPALTAPIIGPRILAQVASAVDAVELSLPAETLAKIDEIFPGPGGPAPQAYAW